MKETVEFIKFEHQRLMDHYGFTDRREMTSANMLKIVEEVGELSQAFLAKDGLQRKEKLDARASIEHEIADVLITTMLLAENLEIDIEKSLEEKIAKIRNRNYQ